MTALDSKVVIITGAARGLGRAYAEAAATAGARVVAADIRSCDETVQAIASAGGEALALELDVGDTQSCQAMAQATLKKFGRIDGLVNNAAMYANLTSARFDELDEDEWDKTMNINVTGV